MYVLNFLGKDIWNKCLNQQNVIFFLITGFIA